MTEEDSKVYDILMELGENGSTNSKIDIIKSNKSNPLFMDVLDAAVNPYRVFHIKQIPDVVQNSDSITLCEFLDELLAFENRVITGNAARDKLAQLLENLSEQNRTIAERIIRKDLRVGVGATLINKAVPSTIPVHPCLKATAQSDKALSRINFPAYSQIKADGMRANIVVRDGVNIYGRSGKLIDLLGQFDRLSHTALKGKVLDGELRVREPDGSWMDRKKGNGLLNKAIRGTVTENIAVSVIFVAWDLIEWDEFSNAKNKKYANKPTYESRWRQLTDIVESLSDPQIVLCENIVVNTHEELMNHYESARSRGEEGVIVKNISHIWEDRRSPDLVKLKAVRDCDLKIVGWNRGKVGTKWENHMGSLICASEDGKIEVAISGFDDELRLEISENIDSYIGKIIAVQYTERITDKNRPNVDSLFSPRFLELREDKDIADMAKDIL